MVINGWAVEALLTLQDSSYGKEAARYPGWAAAHAWAARADAVRRTIREELGGFKPRAEAARRSARSKLKRAVSRVRATFSGGWMRSPQRLR